jgi:hypothetical protein
MAKFDLLSDLNTVHLGLVTLNGTNAVASALVDMRGFEGLRMELNVGTISDAGTASGYTIKLQDSDTTVATDFVDVTAANTPNGVVAITNTLDADDDKCIGVLGYIGIKRYVRVVATGTTNSAGAVYPVATRGIPTNVTAPVALITASTAAT